MIEAEWWEYDSLDELADAVAGDAGFIIESAVVMTEKVCDVAVQLRTTAVATLVCPGVT